MVCARSPPALRAAVKEDGIQAGISSRKRNTLLRLLILLSMHKTA